MSKPSTSVAARIAGKFSPIPFSGCWLWEGNVNNKGYGTIWDANRGKKILAHRASWEIANGAVPDEMCVLHRCDVSFCVNPDHLFLGTVEENNKDMIRKGRLNAGIRQKEQTHCKNGHLFDSQNTYVWNGERGKERQCRQCKKDHARAHS